MGSSALYFLDKIRLVDDFFRTTAAALILTRSEFEALDLLSQKGFFSRERLDRWIETGKIQPVDKAAPAESPTELGKEADKTVMVYHRLNAKFVVTEDDFLRRQLREAGLRVLSTPDLIGHMARKGAITKERAIEAIEALKLFGWHSGSVLEQIKEEIQHDQMG
jgi:predicted nucleic acid-binding protein